MIPNPPSIQTTFSEGRGNFSVSNLISSDHARVKQFVGHELLIKRRVWKGELILRCARLGHPFIASAVKICLSFGTASPDLQRHRASDLTGVLALNYWNAGAELCFGVLQLFHVQHLKECQRSFFCVG
jgi:hypothetical protein